MPDLPSPCEIFTQKLRNHQTVHGADALHCFGILHYCMCKRIENSPSKTVQIANVGFVTQFFRIYDKLIKAKQGATGALHNSDLPPRWVNALIAYLRGDSILNVVRLMVKAHILEDLPSQVAYVDVTYLRYLTLIQEIWHCTRTNNCHYDANPALKFAADLIGTAIIGWWRVLAWNRAEQIRLQNPLGLKLSVAG